MHFQDKMAQLFYFQKDALRSVSVNNLGDINSLFLHIYTFLELLNHLFNDIYNILFNIRLTPEQEELNEVSLKHPRGIILGTPDVLQLNQNLMDIIQAKKVEL